MVRKIPAQDLKPGMKVVDLDLPWLSNPFLYAEEGVIETQAKIDRIVAEGFLEVYIDTSYSQNPENSQAQETGDSSAEVEAGLPEKLNSQRDKLPPKVPINEELPVARVLYDDSVRFARKTIQDLSKGDDLPLQEAEKIVNDVLESITRNYNALLGLVKLRSRDEYTYTHCINVGVLAILLARQMGITEEESRKIGLAGLFHDIGKSRIPDEVLNCPRKLTPEEFTIMKKHPEFGLKLISLKKIPREITYGIIEHHEKFNGKGYPRGLKGEEISLVGRILTIVDVYDALTSKRVYKDPMLPHQALSLMYTMRDEEFDTHILEQFIRSQGIYPVGSAVELSSGWRGLVVEINPEKPLLPKVALLRTPSGKNLYGEVLDLAKQTQIKITRVMGANQAGIEPGMAIPGTLAASISSTSN